MYHAGLQEHTHFYSNIPY